MDSKMMRLALLSSLSVVVLIAVLVLYLNDSGGRNGSASRKPNAAEDSAVAAESSAVESSAAGTGQGRQIGNDLSAFLRDDTFFDPERSEVLESLKDDSDRLSILTTSVEKDLRVLVVGNDGVPVEGITFVIRLTDYAGHTFDFRDLDKDGVIYAGSLSAGEYEVALLPVTDYKIPAQPTRVLVKETVEYVAIDDISVLIKTEDEIDTSIEDTAVKDAVSEGDNSEIVKLQIGGTRTKTGIDVSRWQEDIDWEKVKNAGVEFVIIRCGYRGSVSGTLVEDGWFQKNIRGAKAAGLEVGVYFFTQAIDEKEAVEEASAVLALVQEYDLNLPIYIDTESAGGNGRADGLDVETRTLVCDAFCRTVVNAGEQAGVYASRNWFYNKLNADQLNKYETWLAEYVSTPQYTGYYTMWQYTSKGQIDGINGNVDLDLYYY